MEIEDLSNELKYFNTHSWEVKKDTPNVYRCTVCGVLAMRGSNILTAAYVAPWNPVNQIDFFIDDISCDEMLMREAIE